ncbi:MAG TPA: imidazoleglycerol-phosphate dehydratase, partial [Streptosporangiaceae bacterium]|nr:imidazoleglycerol-phosphate dehydratase [Streptosporangiaceae bacterium]
HGDPFHILGMHFVEYQGQAAVAIRAFLPSAHEAWVVPLDETLVQAAVDLSGRPYVVHHEPAGMAPLIGSYDTTLTGHIFESLAFSAGICLHVRVIEGRNPHHIVEAQFKAVARALRAAAAPDPRAGGIPSTKGVL